MRMPCMLTLLLLVALSGAIELGYHGNTECGAFAEVYIDGVQVNESAQEVSAGIHEINCTARGFRGGTGYWSGHSWLLRFNSACTYEERADFNYFRIEIDGKMVASTPLFGSTNNIGTVLHNHTFEEGVTVVRCAANPFNITSPPSTLTELPYRSVTATKDVYRDIGIGVRPKLECPFESCIDDPRYIDKPCPEGYQTVDHTCEPIPKPTPPAPPTGFITLLEGIPEWVAIVLGILLFIAGAILMHAVSKRS